MLRKMILMLALTALLSLVCVTPVLAYSNDNLTMLTASGLGDYWYNYDFFGWDHIGDEDYVDHPATIVFGLYGFKSSVKSGFDDYYPYSGGTIYNALNDGSGWGYDSDSGRKTSWNDLDAYHYRLYADDGTSMYNTEWGNWTLATTHWDNLWAGGGYGWQEYVEDDLCDIADNDIGWDVYEDEYYFYNYDDFYTNGLCTYVCDGYASYIVVY